MKTKLDDVRNNADQSRSVLANMVGNAAQDLGELGGVAGTAGVAIGQLAEYAADGNISLEQRSAKVAGPMAGIWRRPTIVASNAMKFFATGLQDVHAEAIEAMNDAIMRPAKTPLEAYTELLEGAGRDQLAGQRDQGVKELITDVIGLTDATEDLTPSLLAAGVDDRHVEHRPSRVGDAGRERFVDGLDRRSRERRSHHRSRSGTAIVNAFGDRRRQLRHRRREQAAARHRSSSSPTPTVTLNDILAASADPLTEHTELWDAPDPWTSPTADVQRVETRRRRRWTIARTEATGTDDRRDGRTGRAEGSTNTSLDDRRRRGGGRRRSAAEFESGDRRPRRHDRRRSTPTTSPTSAGRWRANSTRSTTSSPGLKFDVDFQPALNEALDGLDSFGPDLQTLADEWANILEGKPIDIFGNVRADDAEFQAKMADLTNLFQEGVVNAFDQGGVEAANTFVQSTAAQIAASTGLDIAEVYRIMGLPPDGSIDAIRQAERRRRGEADAMAILDCVDRGRPEQPDPRLHPSRCADRRHRSADRRDRRPDPRRRSARRSRQARGVHPGRHRRGDGVARRVRGDGHPSRSTRPAPSRTIADDVDDGDYRGRRSTPRRRHAGGRRCKLLDEATRQPARRRSTRSPTSRRANDATLDAVAGSTHARDLAVACPNYAEADRRPRTAWPATGHRPTSYVNTVGGGGGGGGGGPTAGDVGRAVGGGGRR